MTSKQEFQGRNINEWISDELNKIGSSEELEIASLRRDGTLRKPRTIWVVRVGDDFYVRSVNGRTSDWFRGVQTCHKESIEAGCVDKEVTFVDVDVNDAINDQIDAATVPSTAAMQPALSTVP